MSPAPWRPSDKDIKGAPLWTGQARSPGDDLREGKPLPVALRITPLDTVPKAPTVPEPTC